MFEYANFDIPDSGGIINKEFRLQDKKCALLCGRVLDEKNRVLCGVSILLSERSNGKSTPLEYTVSDGEGVFFFGPLRCGGKYSLHFWINEREAAQQRSDESDTKEAYERYKGIYNKKASE